MTTYGIADPVFSKVKFFYENRKNIVPRLKRKNIHKACAEVFFPAKPAFQARQFFKFTREIAGSWQTRLVFFIYFMVNGVKYYRKKS